MRRKQRTALRSRSRSTRGHLALALAGLATAAALGLSGGARAARNATPEAPSLEAFLRQREGLAPAATPASAAAEQVRSHHQALEQRRADIQGNLPPALRTPRSRRPRLRRPNHDLAGRDAAVGFDADPDNPDRLVSEVKR